MFASVRLETLCVAWAAMTHGNPLVVPTRKDRESFHVALEQLDGAFTRSTRGQSDIEIEFHNASIGDFVARRLAEDMRLVEELMANAVYFEQVSCLVRLDRTGVLLPRPSGRIVDSSVLRNAVKRTFGSDAMGLVSNRAVRTGGVRLMPAPTDRGGRLSELASWESDFGQEWLGFVCEVAHEQLESGDIEKCVTIGICRFIESVIARYDDERFKTWIPMATTIVLKLATYMEQEFDVTAWAEWSGFISRNPEVFGKRDQEEWRERAEEFCMAEIDEILSSAGSETEAEDWFIWLEEIANAWGFDLTDQRDALETWVEERRAQEDHDEGWERPSGGWSVGGDPGGSDHEIDRLFESLAERDQGD